ncbi:MAG: TolC family protein [bacterium]|nr:TolC family protein [bacterium]MBU1918882.1 TolC family protein [bacterium]
MKMYRFLFFILILSSSLFYSFTITASTAIDKPVYRLNINECVEMALRNNEDIKAAGFDIYTYIARKIEATKRYIPVMEYKYRIAPVPRDLNNPAESFLDGDISVLNSIKITAGIPITTFGRLEFSKQLADIGIDAGRLKKKQKADEIVLDIYKLYHGILLARELKVLATKGLNAVDEKIGELEKEENTDQLQILKLKAIFYEVEKRMDEANMKEIIALAMLKVRMGIEDDVNFDLKDRYLKREYYKAKSFDKLLEKSKETRPEFKLLLHQVAAKEKQIILEKKEYFPKLIMGGFFEYGYSPGIIGDETDSDYTNPFNFLKAGGGFELSSQLDFRKIKSRVELAKAEHLKAISDKRSKYRLLEIDLKNAHLEYLQRQKLLDRAEKEKRSARQIVFLTKSNLDIGLGDKKDYLEALQSYLLIQATVFENMYKYNLAIATLRHKLGTLTQAYELHSY